jgi:hypothetical protein
MRKDSAQGRPGSAPTGVKRGLKIVDEAGVIRAAATLMVSAGLGGMLV